METRSRLTLIVFWGKFGLNQQNSIIWGPIRNADPRDMPQTSEPNPLGSVSKQSYFVTDAAKVLRTTHVKSSPGRCLTARGLLSPGAPGLETAWRRRYSYGSFSGLKL